MIKSSATILLTFLAAGALGAVAVACTVGSSTDDDTDGGSSSGQASSSSSGSTSSSSGTAEAGTDADTTLACPALTYPNTLDNEACDACLRQNCCEVTAACWNKADTDPATQKTGCDGYNTALDTCDAESDDVKTCKGFAKDGAQADIPAAYDAYLACHETQCDTACGTAPPDGGAP